MSRAGSTEQAPNFTFLPGPCELSQSAKSTFSTEYITSRTRGRHPSPDIHLLLPCRRSLLISSEKMKHLVEVEPATATTGPAYRNARAKDGLLQAPPGLHSCWDIFR